MDTQFEPINMEPEDQPTPAALVPWYKRNEIVEAKTFKEVLGPRPEYVNLKDHPEMDGKTIAVCNLKYSSGEYGEFVFMGCLILDDNQKPVKAVVIMTGAADVFGRVAMASNVIAAGTPLIGTLHNVGRAWVLD